MFNSTGPQAGSDLACYYLARLKANKLKCLNLASLFEMPNIYRQGQEITVTVEPGACTTES
jgi:hypothetical protein